MAGYWRISQYFVNGAYHVFNTNLGLNEVAVGAKVDTPLALLFA